MTRLYGFKVRAVKSGGRGPDCHVAVRWVMHHVTWHAFNAVPSRWMFCGGWRRRVWDETLEAFGWWGHSHKD